VKPVPAGRVFEEKTFKKLSEKYLGKAYACEACSGRPRLRGKTQVKLTVKITEKPTHARPAPAGRDFE